MKLVAAVTVCSALAAGVAAAPLDLGGPLLGVDLNLGGLNPCLFANLATLTLNSNTALDVGSNTCISIDDCLSVKTREVVRKPALAGLLQIGFCQTKTCPAPQILNSAGVCVNPTVSTPKPEPTKACATGRILNAQGVCVCAPGTIFANSKKETCISTANCDLKFNTATDGVCLRKVCADGKLLSSQLGLCIDASLCALRADRLCKEVKCPANKTLDSKTGLCVSVCTNGLLLTPNKQCITVAACSPLLNTVSDGACIPKACKSNLLTINNNGICVCLPGFTLNKAGTCVLANILK